MDLMHAVELTDIEIVKALIAGGADLNAVHEKGVTVLMRAAQLGHEAIVQALLEAGAEIDMRDGDGYSALMKAAEQGHLDCVNCLMDAHADIGGVDMGLSALMVGAFGGNLEVVKRLIEADANVNQISIRYGDLSALMFAARQNHVHIVRYLVDAGADINRVNYWGDTPLVEASERGHLETVQMLIDLGADLEIQKGGTALIRAAGQGHEQVVKTLIDAGANVNADIDYGRKPGRSALMVAASQGHLETVRVLLQAGADLNYVYAGFSAVALSANEEMETLLKDAGAVYEPETQFLGAGFVGSVARLKAQFEMGTDVDVRDQNGNTALILAAFDGHQDAIAYLLSIGADINATDLDGHSALRWAVLHENTNLIEMLLKSGADVNVVDKDAFTPLITATFAGNKEIVKHLLDAGADVNHQKVDGETALMVAINKREKEIVSLLIDAGADVNLENYAGDTPLREAAFATHFEIVDLLLKAGADVNLANHTGNTPLLTAVERTHVGVVDLLLKAGADVRQRNLYGATPLYQAHIDKYFGSLDEDAIQEIIPKLRLAEDVQCWLKRTNTDELPGEWTDEVILTREADMESSLSDHVEDAMMAMMEEEIASEAFESSDITETDDNNQDTEDEDTSDDIEADMMAMMQEEIATEDSAPSDTTETDDNNQDTEDEDTSNDIEADMMAMMQAELSGDTDEDDQDTEDGDGDEGASDFLDVLIEDDTSPDDVDLIGDLEVEGEDDASIKEEARLYIDEHDAENKIKKLMGSDPCQWQTDEWILFCLGLSALAKVHGREYLSAYQTGVHPQVKDFLQCLIQYDKKNGCDFDRQIVQLFDIAPEPDDLRHQIILCFLYRASTGDGSGMVAPILFSYYKRVDFDAYFAGMYAPYLKKNTDDVYFLDGPGDRQMDDDGNPSHGGYVLDHVTLNELVGALASLAELARKEGILSLEKGIETYQNDVLCEGLRIIMAMMIANEDTVLLLRAYITAWALKKDLHLHLLRIVGHEIIQGHTLATVEPRLRRLAEHVS